MNCRHINVLIMTMFKMVAFMIENKHCYHLKRVLCALAAILFFLIPSQTSASTIVAKQGVVKNGYNFLLYEPDSVAGNTSKPVIVFLHGSSLCGNDLNRVRRYGTIHALEKGCKIDSYVVAPQNPGGSWSPAKVMNVIKWMLDNYNIDNSRIYVIGMSLGGYGAIDVAAAFPKQIAAAMSFCGGGTQPTLSALNEVPLWIVHGTADRAVSIKESDKVVSKIKSADPKTPRLHYDRVAGMNHSQPARFFYINECYDWLLSHSLKDAGRPISAKFDIASISRGAYGNLKSSKTSKLKKKYSSRKRSTSNKKRGKSRKR